MLHFSKKSVLCQDRLDKYGYRWHTEIVAKQLLIRETHHRTLMLALRKKCKGLIMKLYISLKRHGSLRFQAELSHDWGSWDTVYTSLLLPGQTFSQYSVPSPRIPAIFVFHRNWLLFLKKSSAGRAGERKHFKAPMISLTFLWNHTEPQELFLLWEDPETYKVWQTSKSYWEKFKNAVTTINKKTSCETEQRKKYNLKQNSQESEWEKNKGKKQASNHVWD